MSARLPFALTAATLAALLACSDAGDRSARQDADEEYAARMEAEHAGDIPVSSGAVETAPAMAVESQSVTYAHVDGEPVTGYLARPRGAAGPLAAVVVIHEWWGLNDNIRAMADRLAGEGYAALAVDLYQGESADTRERASELARASMGRTNALGSNLSQAITYLREELGATAVGTIGWCFGGGWSLQASLANPERVDATVVYYGRLITEQERLRPLQSPLLGLFGAEDRGIPVESVRAFETALTALGKPNEIHVYEGANHAFANPSGLAYDADAAEDAWHKTLAFLDRHLR